MQSEIVRHVSRNDSKNATFCGQTVTEDRTISLNHALMYKAAGDKNTKICNGCVSIISHILNIKD